MDGTLYDEFDFICQVYHPISQYVAEISNADPDNVYKRMCRLWLEYGSSKADLFQLFFKEFGVEPVQENIRNCIYLFRNSDFNLALPNRVENILEFLKQNDINMFLLTDGNSVLQRRKFFSLGLDRYFEGSKIFISGDYGRDYQKPNVKINDILNEKFEDLSGVIFFGDRDVDEEYAARSGFSFQRVNCMIPNN